MNNYKPHWPYSLNYGSPQARGLVAWWPSGIGSGPRLMDMSCINRNHGTLTSFNASATSGWSSGVDGSKSLIFDGTDDYVDLGAGSKTLTNGLVKATFTQWVKTTSTSRMVGLGSYNGAGSDLATPFDYNRGASIPDAGKIYAIFRDASGNTLAGYTTSATSFNDGRWHLVCVVADCGGEVVKIYVDGTSQSITMDSTAIGSSLSSLSNNLHLGSSNNAGTPGIFYTGSIEDTRIYNRELSASEIVAMYEPASRWSLRYQANRPSWIFAATVGGATAALFRQPSLTGVGSGGPFFTDPLGY